MYEGMKLTRLYLCIYETSVLESRIISFWPASPSAMQSQLDLTISFELKFPSFLQPLDIADLHGFGWSNKQQNLECPLLENWQRKATVHFLVP